MPSHPKAEGKFYKEKKWKNLYTKKKWKKKLTMVFLSSFSPRTTSASMVTCCKETCWRFVLIKICLFWFTLISHYILQDRYNKIVSNLVVSLDLPHWSWWPESAYPGTRFAGQPQCISVSAFEKFDSPNHYLWFMQKMSFFLSNRAFLPQSCPSPR